MEEAKTKKELYDEAHVLHKSLHEKLDMLQNKPYLTDDEELEVKRLKKQKLHYKDLLETLGEELRAEGGA